MNEQNIIATKTTQEKVTQENEERSLTWEEALNDDHDYENCDYDEEELLNEKKKKDEAWDFDGFTS